MLFQDSVRLLGRSLQPGAKDTYADTLRLHVVPFLGKVRLAEMNRRAARNYFTALEEAGRSANTTRQAKVTLGAMFTMAVSDGYLDFHPFHDVKTPKVRGPRAVKIATTDQYLKVRSSLPTKPARVFSTLLVSSGLRFCEAIGLQPMDFDLYTKNGAGARSNSTAPVVELVRAHARADLARWTGEAAGLG